MCGLVALNEKENAEKQLVKVKQRKKEARISKLNTKLTTGGAIKSEA